MRITPSGLAFELVPTTNPQIRKLDRIFAI
jgi:hypothetical protein